MNKIPNFDTEFCGKVPLHQTNLIQPHGVLLTVQSETMQVLQASENADLIFAKPVTDIIGSHLTDFLLAEDIDRLQTVFAGHSLGKIPFSFSVGGARFLGLAEWQEPYFILEIEIEPYRESAEKSFLTIYQDVKMAMSAIEACTTTVDTCRVVAAALKKLSGFDKVMVYCFDEDWNGDVVAEEMESGMESYLGLKFPASDIPKPARDLYKKTPYRLIPTTDYEGVRLYPVINPLTSSFTDLSNSNLRSVAAVHLEYLRNMQVKASMSTRILKDGELWGLIACHHRTPKYVSYEMCSVFELLSNIITAKIAAVQNGDRYQYKAAKQSLHQKVVAAVLAKGGLRSEKETLLQLLDADGIAITTNEHIELAGDTPGKLAVADLVLWLEANAIDGLYHQPSLPSVYEAAEAYAGVGSGLLAIPIETKKSEFVLAFRHEALKSIAWGGNPNEALQFEPDSKRYHPRASFKIWQQTVRKTSTSWRTETLEAAEDLRNFLIESRLNKKYVG